MRTSLRLLAVLASACWLIAPVTAATGAGLGMQPPPATQEPEGAAPANPAPQGPVTLDETTRAALNRLAEDLDQKERQRENLAATADKAALARLDGEIRQLRWQFTSLAAHFDLQQFEQREGGGFDLETEVLELVRPLITKLKELTAEPRQVDDLKAQLEDVEQRLRTARAAAARLDATRAALPADSPARARAQAELEGYWQQRIANLDRERLVLDANLTRLLEEQKSLWTVITGQLQKFLASSGLNLVLCTAVFLAMFFGVSLISNLVLRRIRGREFSARLLEVLLRTAAILLAVAATMVVPYARNDWFLLAVGIVFLLGAGWVIVKTAPQFFEQFRLILNIGAVREGERLLVDGLPFRVDALRFYSRLHNPELQGGKLRVPIKQLIGQRSRPVAPDEPWFPCRQGEVVALQDGVVGTVQLQTPEVVIVFERHDAQRHYPTNAFLQQNPRNLSHGFEIVVRFSIDYRHKPDATDKVPDTLRRALHDGLATITDDGQLHDVLVELGAAGTNALEFIVICEFDGSVAARYYELHRRVNILLVAACNEHGFAIALPQLTLHRGQPAG
jgi:hypothetical protein